MDRLELEGEGVGLTTGQKSRRQKPWLEIVKVVGLVMIGFCIGLSTVLIFWTRGKVEKVAPIETLSGIPPPGKSSVDAPPPGKPSVETPPPLENRVGLAPLKFLVLGDWGREGTYNQSMVAESMGVVAESLNVNFVISTGDNFYEGGLESLEDPTFHRSFTSVYTARSLQTLWYAVLGNHDYVKIAAVQTDPRLKLRDPRWHCERMYTLRRSVCPIPAGSCEANADFFFIDTNIFLNAHWGKLNFTGLLSQATEVENALENLNSSLSSSNATWKFVVGHHPIRSAGVHGDTLELIQSVLPILEEHKVDLYINGHDHALEFIKRTDSPIPLVTSGAGSKCYRPQNKSDELGLLFDHNGQGFVSIGVSPTWLRVDFHDIQGSILYSHHLSK